MHIKDMLYVSFVLQYFVGSLLCLCLECVQFQTEASQVSWSIEIAGLIIIPINDGFYCILVVNLLADDLIHINHTDSLMLLLLLALFWSLKSAPVWLY